MAPSSPTELHREGREAFKLLEELLEHQKRKKSQAEAQKEIDCVRAAEEYGGWLITEHYPKNGRWLITEHYPKKPPLWKAY